MAKTNIERLVLQLSAYHCALFHSKNDHKWQVIYAPTGQHNVMPVASGFNLSEVLVKAHAVMRKAQQDFDKKHPAGVAVEAAQEEEVAGE